ncbi:hypothetical protein CTRI78_v007393 [Colletotrichum trifolii]|uniref:Uncharacterized protein n=1 Tax=Colletotrichum trifolii TaxID=5466 RepID=A0A4R8R8U0_COLTR|nr:hypothetical protein CTRI78_v007393 [Colletotrichum trifolii]
MIELTLKDRCNEREKKKNHFEHVNSQYRNPAAGIWTESTDAEYLYGAAGPLIIRSGWGLRRPRSLSVLPSTVQPVPVRVSSAFGRLERRWLTTSSCHSAAPILRMFAKSSAPPIALDVG